MSDLQKSIAAELEATRGFAEWWKSVEEGARFELAQRGQDPCAYSRYVRSAPAYADLSAGKIYRSWSSSWDWLPEMFEGLRIIHPEHGPLVLQFREGTGRITELLTIPIDWLKLMGRKGIGKERKIKYRVEDLDADLVLCHAEQGAEIPRYRLAPAGISQTVLVLGQKCPAGPAIAEFLAAYWEAKNAVVVTVPKLRTLLTEAAAINIKHCREDYEQARENAKKPRV